jgi:decaprenylphospho-beta-D-erythro-pentofuranosid-2-ulose 2-reductase
MLIGSTSEIGISIISNLVIDKKTSIYFVGRQPPPKNKFLDECGKYEFIELDLFNYNSFQKILNSNFEHVHLDLVIIAAGYLPQENCDLNLASVQESIRVNGESIILTLASLTSKMISQPWGQILLLSSVSVVRPRIRNFTYASSKLSADFFARGLAYKYNKSSLKIKIIRFGFVQTKLTTNFNPAPFATSADKVSKIVVNNLENRNNIIYVPKKLKYVMNIARFIPRSIFDRLS